MNERVAGGRRNQQQCSVCSVLCMHEARANVRMHVVEGTDAEISRGDVLMIPGTKEFFIATGPHPDWGGVHTVWGRIDGAIDSVPFEPASETTDRGITTRCGSVGCGGAAPIVIHQERPFACTGSVVWRGRSTWRGLAWFGLGTCSGDLEGLLKRIEPLGKQSPSYAATRCEGEHVHYGVPPSEQVKVGSESDAVDHGHYCSRAGCARSGGGEIVALIFDMYES
eukprot:364341-Chlamydomonas_euryale.AAC.22